MEKMLYVKGSMECARIPAGVVVEEDVEMTDTCSTVYVCMLMCTCTHICVHKHCRGTFRFWILLYKVQLHSLTKEKLCK